MRVKRQKRHRKVVRFYSTCFGFREPYKVLLDGTFVHHLLLHGLAPADSSLSHLLGSRSLLFTTRCVIGELRSLGESHAAALDAAKQLITARCEHEKRVSATACIESVIGEENSEHFFVATQDTDLRKKLREVPSVPIIFGLRNSLFIEQPSSQQREFIKSTEEKRLHMSESEFQKIHKRASLMGKTAEGSDGDVEEQAAGTVSNTARRMLGVAQKSKFKRKKAKRPNPLSCKKKTPKPEVSLPKVQEVKAEGSAKRKRIRKRSRVSKE